MPLSPLRPVLARLAQQGLLVVYGGTSKSAVLTLSSPGDANLEDGTELEKVGRYRLRLEADGVTIIQRYFVARRAS